MCKTSNQLTEIDIKPVKTKRCLLKHEERNRDADPIGAMRKSVIEDLRKPANL